MRASGDRRSTSRRIRPRQHQLGLEFSQQSPLRDDRWVPVPVSVPQWPERLRRQLARTPSIALRLHGTRFGDERVTDERTLR